MYAVNPCSELQNGYRIFDRENDTILTVDAGRGAIPTSFQVGGREMLYLDEITYRDHSANVRGGCPVLFPSCGRLRDKIYQYRGKMYSLETHGFARDLSWQVEAQGDSTLILAVESNQETLERFPFAFRLQHIYRVEHAAMSITQRVCNRSEEKMPFSIGLHPYFRAERSRALVHLPSNLYLDPFEGTTVPFDGCMAFDEPVDRVVLRPSCIGAVLDTGLGYTISLDCAGPYHYLVVWSPEGAGFVCVEPWSAKPNALNTGEDLIYLEPGADCSFTMKVTVDFSCDP